MCKICLIVYIEHKVEVLESIATEALKWNPQRQLEHLGGAEGESYIEYKNWLRSLALCVCYL